MGEAGQLVLSVKHMAKGMCLDVYHMRRVTTSVNIALHLPICATNL
jgi:hypothetical protein